MAPILAVVIVTSVVSAVVAVVARLYPRTELGGALRLEHATERHLVDSPRWRRLLRARTDPAEATGLALTAAMAVLVAGVAVAGVVFAMVRANTGLERWDLRLARWGAEHATDTSTEVLRQITQLGGTEVSVVVALVVALLEYRRTGRRAVVGFLTLALVGQNVIVNATKWVVDRARPDVDRLSGFSGASFPSGHAATAATTYAAIALLLGWHRPLRVRMWLSAGAAGITAAVAATRVLLGVHWFTDVVAGVAVGWAWFAVSAIAFGGRLLQFGAPVEVAERAVADRPEDASTV